MAMYTLDEVHRHKTKDSLWVAHEGKVYDVTGFADRHPGGLDILEKEGGDDVTNLMSTAPHSHSLAAYEILNKYCIGELKNFNNKQKSHNGGTKGLSKDRHHVTNSGTERGDEDTGGFTMLGWREDEIINWKKPVFWQVGNLGKDYNEWVHSPVDRHIRLFHSDFVEFFSETPWWMIPLIWLPISAVFLYCGIVNLHLNDTTIGALNWGYAWFGEGVPLPVIVVAVVATSGAVMWTFLEYIVHRWLFHSIPPANSPFLITAHFILHGQHHKAPFDKGRLVFPPVAAIGFVLPFWSMYMLIFVRPIAQILVAGTFVGYIFYDLTHYYLHHGGTPTLDYYKRLKTYHVKHHFQHQNKGFGISSKFWDYPFNTLIPDSPRRKKAS